MRKYRKIDRQQQQTEDRKRNKREEAQCRFPLRLADDFGDNSATYHCEKPKLHSGPNEYSGQAETQTGGITRFSITWS